MSRIVRGGLIQATLSEPATSPVAQIRASMIDKHLALIAEAAKASCASTPSGSPASKSMQQVETSHTTNAGILIVPSSVLNRMG